MWYGGSMTCILLGFDQFFEMLFPDIAKVLFGSKVIYVWLAFPIIYMLGSFFDVPHVFNIVHHAFYFDPYIGSQGFEGNPGVRLVTFPSTSTLLISERREHLFINRSVASRPKNHKATILFLAMFQKKICDIKKWKICIFK